MAHALKSPRLDTRAALLEAAGPVFARVGFQATTVKEICDRAGANIAAVNYHFGDKMGLYQEVLRRAHELTTDFRKLISGSEKLPPHTRLRFFIHAFLEHLFGEGQPSWFARVIAHEMASPTSALTQLIETEARPGFERLKKIICDIILRPVNDDEVVLCANSVMGQCLHYFHSRQIVAELWPGLEMTSERVNQIADHVTQFSLLALAQIGQGKSGTRKRGQISPTKKTEARTAKSIAPKGTARTR